MVHKWLGIDIPSHAPFTYSLTIRRVSKRARMAI